MAPLPPRRSIPKDRFSAHFSTLKTQTYHDPTSRTPGSHTLRTLSWSPTGTLIATGSADRTLRIWNPDRPFVKNSTELRGHTGAIERVAWNPTAEAELASCSADGTVRLWDVRSKRCTATVAVGGDAFTLAWAGDGSVLLVGRKDDALVALDVVGGGTGATSSLVGGRAPMPQGVQTNQTAFGHATPAAEVLVATGEGSVKVVEWLSGTGMGTGMGMGEVLHTLHAHTSACFSLELCPRGRYLAVGGSDALITLWDTTEWVCRRSLSAMVGAVRSLSFSFDGSFVVGGSDEGCGLEIAHVETGEYVHTVPTTSPAPYVAWHPSRYWLAYSGDTMGLKIVGAGGGSG